MSNIAKTVGYAFQKLDIGVFRAAEAVLTDRKRFDTEIKLPLISVCGPPRSGTTLTFQVLTQAFDCLELTNLHYLFYKTPLIGLRISRALTKPYVSDYKSEYGFIKGLNGPAQAYLFWRYWCDQDLNQKSPSPGEKRLRRFRQEMNAIYSEDKRPFLTGFLGHCFYIDRLKSLFPQCAFIRVKREMLASAKSLLKFMPRTDPDCTELGSAVPEACQRLGDTTVHEKVAAQIYHINTCLDQFEQNYGDKIFGVQYRDLCRSPEAVIEKLTGFLKRQNINAVLRTDTDRPKFFKESTASRNDNEETRKIADALDALVEKHGQLSVAAY